MTKTKSKRFDVLSPDGISIEREGNYKSVEEAQAALTKWMKRYEAQGYYSSNSGRIALSELAECCEIIEL